MQRLRYRRNHFAMHEVFGQSSQAADNEDETESMRDCIICYNEPCDTVVMPCRHLCICHHCMGSVLERLSSCPICRERISSVVQIQNHGESRKSSGVDVLDPSRSLT